MIILHLLSWLTLILVIIPLSAAILFIKNRSAIRTWIRTVQHPERWLLHTRLPASATQADIQKALRLVVTESKNAEWNASCAYKRRDPKNGDWMIGLVSNKKPQNNDTTANYSFSQLPATTVIRASCPANERNEHIHKDLNDWSEKHGIKVTPRALSLSSQSYQCWEWEAEKPNELPPPSIYGKFAERIFEMKDIALYPTLITAVAICLCGTGSFILVAIGVFTIILMSGAHKFVFMHQREDITQEEHLQNY